MYKGVCVCLRLFASADEEGFLPQLYESDNCSDDVLEHKQATQVSFKLPFFKMFFGQQ